jgi:hypothetical protein
MQVTQPPALQQLAYGLTAAFDDPDVRALMIHQMRESPIVEHRISLQKLMLDSNGLVLNKAARGAGISAERFSATLASIPPMQIYGALPVQRASWTVDNVSPSLAISIDGEHFLRYDSLGHIRMDGDTVSAPGIEFVLDAAVTDTYRFGFNQAYSPNMNTIQSKREARGSLKVEVKGANGARILSLDVAKELHAPQSIAGLIRSHLQRVMPDSEGTPQPSRPSGFRLMNSNSLLLVNGHTFLEDFGVWEVRDGGLFLAEIELKFWRDGDDECCEVKYRWEEVDAGDILVADTAAGYSCEPLSGAEYGENAGCVKDPFIAVYGWHPGLNGYSNVRVEIWETDPGSDEYFGTNYWDENDVGSIVTKDYIGNCYYSQLGWPLHGCGWVGLTF